MPEQVRCPSCKAPLRVPDNLLGKNVRCPKCQTTFTAEMEEPEEPERITREPRPSSVRRRPPPPEELEEEEPPQEEELEEEHEERPRRRRRGGGRRRAAEAAVAGPATALIVLGIIDLVMVTVLLLLRLLGIGLLAAGAAAGQKGAPEMANGGAYLVGNIFGTILGFCFAGAILMGGLKMKKLENFGSVVTAAILALLPCGNCCIIGLPLGIWALVVLFRPEVKEAFR